MSRTLLVLALATVACGARTGLEVGDDGEGAGDGAAGGTPAECTPGEKVSCYGGASGTAGVGACKAGERVCTSKGVFGFCEGEVVPGVEVCNGVDDDCDGVQDEACVLANGCADGTREGFVDDTQFPNIAGCAGGFTVPGVLADLVQTCGGAAGNDSGNSNGNGCSAADLCSDGFVVCETEADVAARSPSGCTGVTAEPDVFFVTRQSGTGCGKCAMGTSFDPICESCACADNCAPTPTIANDVFGCGTVGDITPSCGVLDRFSNDVCGLLPLPWQCSPNGCGEALNVSKPGPGGGGVLCCRVVPQ